MKSKKLVAFAATLCLLIGTWGGGVSVSAAGFAADGENEALRSYFLGDINGDWEVNSMDARKLFQVTAGAEQKEEAALQSVGDINQDGTVNAQDALLLYQHSAGMIEVSGMVYADFSVVTAPLDGEAVPCQVVYNQILMQPDAPDEDCRVMVVQSLPELRAIYQNDQPALTDADGNVADYTAGYDEAFFEQNALIVLFVHTTNWPDTFTVDGMVKNGGAIGIQVTTDDGVGMQPMPAGIRTVVKIEKDSLNGVGGIAFFNKVVQP